MFKIRPRRKIFIVLANTFLCFYCIALDRKLPSLRALDACWSVNAQSVGRCSSERSVSQRFKHSVRDIRCDSAALIIFPRDFYTLFTAGIRTFGFGPVNWNLLDSLQKLSPGLLNSRVCLRRAAGNKRRPCGGGRCSRGARTRRGRRASALRGFRGKAGAVVRPILR